jgi:hypothetical protein
MHLLMLRKEYTNDWFHGEFRIYGGGNSEVFTFTKAGGRMTTLAVLNFSSEFQACSQPLENWRLT